MDGAVRIGVPARPPQEWGHVEQHTGVHRDRTASQMLTLRTLCFLLLAKMLFFHNHMISTDGTSHEVEEKNR